jgi:hypothetical protein
MLVSHSAFSVASLTRFRLAFYYPILGLINLFVHVLKHPLLPSVASDTALMDVIGGHFARLEFASSGELAFPFARELSNLARLAVKKSQQERLSEKRQDSAEIGKEANIFNLDGGYFTYDQRSCLVSEQGTSFDNVFPPVRPSISHYLTCHQK